MTASPPSSEPRTRATQASQTIFLTLVSLVCSLAFGYLLSTLRPERLLGPSADLLYWLKVLATLQMILVIWHEYAMNTILLRWVLGYFDSAILFLVGITFFATIVLIDHSAAAWLFGMAAFSTAGGLAYVNQYVKARREPFNREVLDLERFHATVVPLAGAGAAYALAAGAWLASAGAERIPGAEALALIGANLLLIAVPVITYRLRRPALG